MVGHIGERETCECDIFSEIFSSEWKIEGDLQGFLSQILMVLWFFHVVILSYVFYIS